jgi:hypothetical protein
LWIDLQKYPALNYGIAKIKRDEKSTQKCISGFAWFNLVQQAGQGKKNHFGFLDLYIEPGKLEKRFSAFMACRFLPAFAGSNSLSYQGTTDDPGFLLRISNCKIKIK